MSAPDPNEPLRLTFATTIEVKTGGELQIVIQPAPGSEMLMDVLGISGVAESGTLIAFPGSTVQWTHSVEMAPDAVAAILDARARARGDAP